VPGFADIAASLALILPLGGGGLHLGVDAAREAAPLEDSQSAHHTPAPSAGMSEKAPESRGLRKAQALQPDGTLGALRQSLRRDLQQRQIRIEQRVVVRIAPRRAGERRNMMAQLEARRRSTRYKERKTDRCVPLENIAGVETGSGNRLILFLLDADILSINLEKACRARDFYSGFYVERAKDGQLCVDRDTLQSRNGARCDIERMMELVAIEE